MIGMIVMIMMIAVNFLFMIMMDSALLSILIFLLVKKP